MAKMNSDAVGQAAQVKNRPRMSGAATSAGGTTSPLDRPARPLTATTKNRPPTAGLAASADTTTLHPILLARGPGARTNS